MKKKRPGEGMMHKDKERLKNNYVKTPTVYQMEATECGAASLAMVLAYYGREESLEKLRIETGVSRDGVNAKNIMAAGRKYGMEVHGYRKGLKELFALKPPCILHWNFNHFVVWEGIKGGSPYLNDPAMGRRKLTVEDIDKCFTGVVLTFQPTKEFVRSRQKSSLLTFIRNRLRGQQSPLIGLVLMGLCLVLPGLAIPAFSQVFIDDILLHGNTKWLNGLLLAMIGTVLFQAALTWYRSVVLQKLELKLSLTSAFFFINHMFRLPISFFDQRHAGDLSQRVENNNNVSIFLAGELAESILNIFVAAFYLVLLLMYSPLLTLIGVAGIAVNLILIFMSSSVMGEKSMKLQQDRGAMVGTLFAGISLFETLKASGSENEYIARLSGFHAKSAETEQNMAMFQQVLAAIPEATNQIISVVLILIGGIMIINGEMTSGSLIAFSALMTSFIAPVQELVSMIQQIQTVKADMRRVEDIEHYELDKKYSQSAEYVEMDQKLQGEVELKDISFGYNIMKPALVENFHFKLLSGNSIAFVGASGSGKSTVAKMISGLYQPWGGEILFDGIPVSKIPPEILYASISTVSQKITLFAGTIRDNLTMWNSSIMERDIIEAAKDACIHETITKMPGAYDAVLSENGSNLSGGQRQRLEIARALVSNPSILIMDEATSALDPIVEKQIVDNIKRRGCTCIIVAHRLSAIRDCDEIIVMQYGKIVQRGSHDELKDIEGPYSKLIKNL
ncbi:MAG TPA: NHLP family bacteriocin export ABC transporter peptidase/permease/ATPase subunit [Lachnospiraceae bacterium]|nr:NHLP family bacteriocin export ABC transporter peptidase/permease/ATPase subunit [Lachnospiraceae bacterium]